MRQSLVLSLPLAVALLGCGSAPPPPKPSATPAATVTPTIDLHLTGPASVNDLFVGLTAAGLNVVGNNSTALALGREPQTRINATYESWPLILEEYSSAKALKAAAGLDRAWRPGDAPYDIIGMNIVVAFGPRDGRLGPPEERFHDAAVRLVDALNRLIGPVRLVAVEALPLPSGSVAQAGSAARPSPSAPAPSAS